MADYGVSNRTYNLMSTLLNKLQGLGAYDKYEKDLSDEEKKIFEQIRKDDQRHVEMLTAAIEKLAQGGGLK